MAKKMSFEDGMLELESIAREMESGEMSLDESFNAYKRAIQLKKALEKLLNEGDKKIRVLMDGTEIEKEAEDIL